MRMIGLLAVIVGSTMLASCSSGDSSQPENESLVESDASSSGSGIPAQWEKYESKDDFTDEITKSYTVNSNSTSSYKFSVACSKANHLNFYFEYPSRSGTPSTEMEVNVRLGSAEPFSERWYVSWVGGSTRVENPQQFYEKIKGQSKLAVEIFAASRGAYDITGIDAVVADMQATACKFEQETPPPAEAEPETETDDAEPAENAEGTEN